MEFPQHLVALRKERGLTKKALAEQLDQFTQHFRVANETAAVTSQFVTLMGDFKVGDKQVHDANIVATLLAYGILSLLKHNTQDFARFGKLIHIEGL